MKYIVAINSKQYEVEVEQGTATVLKTADLAAPVAASVSLPGSPVSAPVPVAATAVTVTGDGEKVSAPMPGAILAVKVTVGQMVKKGDVMVVLEAMKMENDVVAPCDGMVEYTVAKGAQVQVGELLAVIK